MKKAALYLRSSKDRSDVSIAAQRRELETLAQSREIRIVKEFSDTVESAKDEDRPGFQALLADLKSTYREWNTLLITDTSRLSRRQYMAYVFDHEAKRRGISIIYSKLPETDPITDMVIKGVFRVFDEFHSMMSRQKGLAGMRENVKQGWRAGGRAPIGYRLVRVNTGAIRDGEPVTKSHLEPSDDAPRVARYLKARASGTPRGRLDLELNKSSLVDIEWNALLYAGNTIWNMRYPKNEGRKRRPRTEWVIQEQTHTALITQAEAEIIINRLENNQRKPRMSKKYLLTGLMVTPDGKTWQGTTDRGKSYYRTPGRRVPAMEIEKAIINKVKSDTCSPQFLTQLTNVVKAKYNDQHDLKPLQQKIRLLNTRIADLVNLTLEMENKAPALRNIDDLENQRETLVKELDRLKEENSTNREAANITEAQVKKALQWHDADIKDHLPSLVEKIILNPQTIHCEILYGVKVASPRGTELVAVLAQAINL